MRSVRARLLALLTTTTSGGAVVLLRRRRDAVRRVREPPRLAGEQLEEALVDEVAKLLLLRLEFANQFRYHLGRYILRVHVVVELFCERVLLNVWERHLFVVRCRRFLQFGLQTRSNLHTLK
jgi:hypothetical protein